MGIMILLILISLFVAIIFLVIFIWSVRTGQFDDTFTPSVRMLFDDSGNVKESGGKTIKNVKKKDATG
jgi:cbb3-type cytochrome oxidase maturation protein